MVHANASKPRMVHRQCSFALFPSSTDLGDVKAILTRENVNVISFFHPWSRVTAFSDEKSFPYRD